MSAHKPLSAGDPAPDFRLLLLGGGEAALSDLAASGPLVLAFFKVTCPVCQLTLPYLERIHAAGTLRIYGVSQNGAGETRRFNQEYGITLPVLLDPEHRFPASNAYGITHVPTLFVVEVGGAISAVVNGWSRRDIKALAERAGVSAFRPGEYVPEWKSG